VIARISWYLGLAAIAGATALLQLDRQTAVSPELVGLVPEPFRAVSQARIAAESLAAADPAQALDEAEKLVLRRPVPAQSLRLLALAQYRAGQLNEGSLSIQYAAKRGWRDVVAQEAMARLALAAGDTAEAARRYSALLARQETPDALLESLGAEIFARDDGVAIEAMADITSGSDRWIDLFLRRGVRVMPADAFSKVVVKSIAKGAAIDCRTIDRLASTIGRRDSTAASRLSAAAPECAAGSGS